LAVIFRLASSQEWSLGSLWEDILRRGRSMAEVRADHIQLIFIREIGKQASWAMRAANDLNGAQAELCLLKDKIAQGGKLEAALLKRNVDDVFRLVEIFLYHVGRISLLLWNKKREDRGKALRQLLEIGDESPLRLVMLGTI